MPRGRRPRSTSASALEAELNELKARSTELRSQLRKLRSGDTEIRKLEEKLEKQLSGARWLAAQITQLRPSWDELDFYKSVAAKKPTPRGRRPRSAAPDAG